MSSYHKKTRICPCGNSIYHPQEELCRWCLASRESDIHTLIENPPPRKELKTQYENQKEYSIGDHLALLNSERASR